MIKKIIVLILKLSPSSKRWFWKKWYNIFAKRARNPELKLMNYGYDSQNMDLRLEKEDEVERFSIQLYHYVTSHADMKNKDILEVADALTDILYVTYGAGHAFGIDLDKCFEEVQNSNMSKLDQNGKPIYNESGKVLKGPNYFKPDLSKFVN